MLTGPTPRDDDDPIRARASSASSSFSEEVPPARPYLDARLQRARSAPGIPRLFSGAAPRVGTRRAARVPEDPLLSSGSTSPARCDHIKRVYIGGVASPNESCLYPSDFKFVGLMGAEFSR